MDKVANENEIEVKTHLRMRKYENYETAYEISYESSYEFI